MSAPERVIILKSWETRDDTSVIKEVATKGEYVDLCMAYLARKKHLPIDECRKYFHKIVDSYVNRLLNEKLIFKAEDVLKNVSRDWKSFYYQFAFETKLTNIRDLIFDHIKKKNIENFDNEYKEYEIYWKILKNLQKSSNSSSVLYNELQNELKQYNLESLYQKDNNYKKILIIRYYFDQYDKEILNIIDINILWNYLVDKKLYTELIKWCNLSKNLLKNEDNENSNCNNNNINKNETIETETEIEFETEINRTADKNSINNLTDLYRKSYINSDMYEYGLKNLQNINTDNNNDITNVIVIQQPIPIILRDFFAFKGYFFDDEKSDPRKLLRRIFDTGVFYENLNVIDNCIEYEKFLLENNVYVLLVDDEFSSVNKLNKLKNEFPDKQKEIEFIIKLKDETLNNEESFLNVSNYILEYLKENNNKNNDGDDNDNDNNLWNDNNYCLAMIKLFEFLVKENDFERINTTEYSIILENLPYIQSLYRRKYQHSDKIFLNKYKISDLLKKYKHFDLNEIDKDAGNEVISLSNKQLGKKYGYNIKLNYIHYLRQLRSSYAVYNFFIRQLQDYSQITKSQLYNASEIVTELAIKNFTKDDFVIHCIVFIEQLGFDTQYLRSFIQLLKIVYSSITPTSTDEIKSEFNVPSSSCSSSPSSSLQLSLSKFKNLEYNELIEIAEKIIFKDFLIKPITTSKATTTTTDETDIIEDQKNETKTDDNINNGNDNEKINESTTTTAATEKSSSAPSQPLQFPFQQYNAIMKVSQAFQNKYSPCLYLSYLCEINDWWRFLIIIQYYDISLQQIKSLLKKFKSKTIQEHLSRALLYEPVQDVTSKLKRRSSISRQRSKGKADNLMHTHTSGETITTSSISSSSDVNTLYRSSIIQAKFLQDDDNLDIFAIIILSTNNNIPEDKIISYMKFLDIIFDTKSLSYSTSINLIKNSIKYNNSTLCLLAAMLNDSNLKYIFLISLIVSIDDVDYKILQKSKNYDDIFWIIIEKCVRMNYIETLNRNFQLFYEESTFSHLIKFLHQTYNRKFTDDVIDELRLYLLAWSNNEIDLPIDEYNKDFILYFTVKLLLIHLKYNFQSIILQQNYLDIICKSGINDICLDIDFCLIRKIFKIIITSKKNDIKYNHRYRYSYDDDDDDDDNQENYDCNNDYIDNNDDNDYNDYDDKDENDENYYYETNDALINYDYEKLIIFEDDKYVKLSINEIDNLLIILQNNKQYDKAIKILNILNISCSDIVYTKWINNIDLYWPDKFNFIEYEYETKLYSLQPEILVNFYLHVAALYAEPCQLKYLMMKKSLDVIKMNHLFPNECFDRDNIEYEMILCYLQNIDQNIDNLNIYYSEYYEQILSKEKCVLYKSFEELKELAGVEELTITTRVQLTENMKKKLSILLNKLLDDGDIVETLRLQAIFDYWTLDLHFIVFCMGLAEGLTSLHNLSPNERQLLTAVEIQSITKFNKRTLGGRIKPSPQSLSPNLISSSSSSPGGGNRNPNEQCDDSWSTLDFEEIPPREKQDILEAIQGLASRLKHGIDIGKRILMVYRAAMYLDKDYLDVLRIKDITILLKSATEDDCLQKLLVVSDIMTSTQMSQTEIAEFLSYEIITAIIRPRFYIFRADQTNINFHLPIKSNLWGYDLDKEFHLFLELCPNTTLLGNYLLDYCDTLKIYRKYQDNKDYQNDINQNPRILNKFENLKEIIQMYGLPPSSTNNQNLNSQSYNYQNQLTSQVLSHKKQNIINIELLIKAHECFVHECSMEGIANVLNRSKILNSTLCTAKSWNLIVRMLTGIERYREMYYCFDALIKNDQFESLLGQFDDTKANGLRNGILWYISQYCPENKEYYKLTALHFLMFKELAQLCEQEINSMTAKILSKNEIHIEDNHHLNNINTAIPSTSKNITSTTSEMSVITTTKITRISSSSETLNQLNEILENYVRATEYYLLDNKLISAKKSSSSAELIAVQIDLMNKSMSSSTLMSSSLSSSLSSSASSTSASRNCVCLLNVQSQEEFKELINKELNVPQAIILGRNYSYDINWSEAILNQYVLLDRNSYLTEFMDRIDLTDNIIENIVKNFQLLNNINTKMEEKMENLVKLIQSVSQKYKLASLLGFKDILTMLINDQSSYYLKDINYGRSNNTGLTDE